MSSGYTKKLKALSKQWMAQAVKEGYANHWTWMGKQTIQIPQDLMAIQEIIYREHVNLVIEVGVFNGGSAEFYCNCGVEVIGVDWKRRLSCLPNWDLIVGSSLDPQIYHRVQQLIQPEEAVLVILDSNHSHQHVLREMEAYGKLVTPGSYMIVMDTGIEDYDDGLNDGRWGKGNNPKTAVWEYLKTHPEFEIDHSIEDKILLTSCPDGYLRRVK